MKNISIKKLNRYFVEDWNGCKSASPNEIKMLQLVYGVVDEEGEVLMKTVDVQDDLKIQKQLFPVVKRIFDLKNVRDEMDPESVPIVTTKMINSLGLYDLWIDETATVVNVYADRIVETIKGSFILFKRNTSSSSSKTKKAYQSVTQKGLTELFNDSTNEKSYDTDIKRRYERILARVQKNTPQKPKRQTPRRQPVLSKPIYMDYTHNSNNDDNTSCTSLKRPLTDYNDKESVVENGICYISPSLTYKTEEEGERNSFSDSDFNEQRSPPQQRRSTRRVRKKPARYNY